MDNSADPIHSPEKVLKKVLLSFRFPSYWLVDDGRRTLTFHHMEPLSALDCILPVQSIKNKYQQGFTSYIKIKVSVHPTLSLERGLQTSFVFHYRQSMDMPDNMKYYTALTCLLIYLLTYLLTYLLHGEESFLRS